MSSTLLLREVPVSKRFIDPTQAILMGSYVRFEPEREILGNLLPAAERTTLVIAWVEDGKIREGTVPYGMVPREIRSETVVELQNEVHAGDSVSLSPSLRVWHGAPPRSGEQYYAATGNGSLVDGRIVGTLLRYVTMSKSGTRPPRLIPFVVVRATTEDGITSEIVARIEGGAEWVTSEAALLPQLDHAEQKLRQLYPANTVVRLSPHGRGGYWQVDEGGLLTPPRETADVETSRPTVD